MKKFFIGYGLCLLGLFAAFSYLESHTKDQRMLKAKMRQTFRLVGKGECESAFNLLTQRQLAPLQRYYADKDLEQLQKEFCRIWQNTRKSGWSHQVKKADKPDLAYHIDLKHKTSPATYQLYFTKKQGELALVKVEGGGGN